MAWRQAIVVGASSGIGQELSRQLAAQGCRVAMVSRRELELARIADEINSTAGRQITGDGSETKEGPETGKLEIENCKLKTAVYYVHDVTHYEDVPALFQQICRDLGGLDLIIYSSGIMPVVEEDEYNFEKDRPIIEVNVLGAIAWLNEAVQRFSKGGAGTIVGISSVAGDRGRRGNPVYGASKAALDHYLEALRNRVSQFSVSVVTIKPGPVDTPMTKGRDKLPMLISPQDAAKAILNAAAARVHTAYVPWKWRPVAFILRNIPSFLFRKLKV